MADFRELTQMEARTRNDAWKIRKSVCRRTWAICRNCCGRSDTPRRNGTLTEKAIEQTRREKLMSLAKLQDLTGRVALVTGGSRGLGLQMAEVLGELGAKVAITARKRDELEAAAGHLKSLGVEALPLVCDMGDLATIPSMVEQVIASLGPIDILVNNAGTSWERRQSGTSWTAGTR